MGQGNYSSDGTKVLLVMDCFIEEQGLLCSSSCLQFISIALLGRRYIAVLGSRMKDDELIGQSFSQTNKDIN